MTEREYLLCCEVACRKVFYSLEAMSLHQEPTLSEYRKFREGVEYALEIYWDALSQRIKQSRLEEPELWYTL